MQPADENNVGKCVDFFLIQNQVVVNKQGYKIIGIMPNVLIEGDDRYQVRSNFGNGDDTTVIFPREVTAMYNCPGDPAPAPVNENVEMAGGRKRRRNARHKSRKSRKARKSSKKTRKH